MGRSGLQELKPLCVARDAWRATTRAGAIAARQAARLEALVWHARLASRFDADHYREVPPGPIRPEAFYRRVAPLATISVEGTHRRDLTVFRWRAVVRPSWCRWRSLQWSKRPEAPAATRCCRQRQMP